tara:strand:- start:3230 stop:3574 length:345 start_codon:yes stop_codon:yes gene_type:complete
MTKLKKTINREVTINGEDVIASMEPCGEFRIRRKRCRIFDSVPMSSIIDQPQPGEKNTGDVFHKSANKSKFYPDSLVLNRIKARVAITPLDYEIKIEVLAAIDSLLEVEEMLKA